MSYEGSVLHRIQKLDTANQVNFINNEQLNIEIIKFHLISEGQNRIINNQNKITKIIEKIGIIADNFNKNIKKEKE